MKKEKHKYLIFELHKKGLYSFTRPADMILHELMDACTSLYCDLKKNKSLSKIKRGVKQ